MLSMCRVSVGGGLNPTYCPAASGNSLRMRSTTHEGMTTQTFRPRKPQHQMSALPAGTDGEERKEHIVCFSILFVNRLFIGSCLYDFIEGQ